MEKDLPRVTVIIPCRNEAEFIGRCLDSVMANDYPRDKLEVLVVDGRSSDGTREEVSRRQPSFTRLRLLDNPKKTAPCAFNIGIREAQGEAIMIMGAHSIYEPDYIAACIRHLREDDADNVGGVMVTKPRQDTPVGRAIVCCLSHPFGVGNSAFRVGSKEKKWTDTVFGGCYRKRVFERIGLFNEELEFSSDIELNRRLRKAGGKVLFVPGIVSTYYARSTFGAFIKHVFRNGVWAIFPLKYVHNLPVSWRHFVPLAFILGLISSGFLSIFVPAALWLFLSIVLIYLATGLYFSARIALEKKDMKYFLTMPAFFAALHLVYGAGSFWAAVRLAFSGRFWRNRFKNFLIFP